MMDVDWSSLPGDILAKILEELKTVDLMRSKAVCRHWKSVPTRKRSVPWLLFSDFTISSSSIKEYNLQNRFEKCSLKKRIPELGFPGHVVGSSNDGWVLHEERSSQCLRAFNLITNKTFNLPHYSTMWITLEEVEHEFPVPVENNRSFRLRLLENPKSGFRLYVAVHQDMGRGYLRALTCCCPRSDGDSRRNVTVVIDERSHRLAFSVEGDLYWTILVTPIVHFQDLMYFDGLFYALNSFGQLVSCDLRDPSSPKITMIHTRNFPFLTLVDHEFLQGRYYLFELSGDLCCLWERRHLMGIRNNNGEFLGYSHNMKVRLAKLVRPDDDEYYQWVEMSGLGDHALFLGKNNSVCLSTKDHHRPQVQPNRIYFDTFVEFQYQATSNKGNEEPQATAPQNTGEFDLNEGNELEQDFLGGVGRQSVMFFPQTTWVMPFSI